MSYRVKKTIEFDENSAKPVSILRGAILEKDNGEQVIQLKLCNTGEDILNKVAVKIICLSQDKQVLGTQKYEYQKIFVKLGEIFGTDIPIPMEYNDTDTFSVEFDNNERLQVKSCKRKREKVDFPTALFNLFSGMVFCINILLVFFLVWCIFDPYIGTVPLAPQVIPGILFPCALVQIYFREAKEYKAIKFSSLFFFILICAFPFLGGWAKKEVYRAFIIIMIWVILISVTLKKKKKDIRLILALFIMFMIGMYFTYRSSAASSELIKKVIEDIDNERALSEMAYGLVRGEGIGSIYNSRSFIISSNNLQVIDSLGRIGWISLTQVIEQMESEYYQALRLLRIGNILRLFSILGIYLWSALNLLKIKFQILPSRKERKL